MSKQNILSAIDIGTEKVTTVISASDSSGSLRILGVSSVPSKGIKKSQIVGLDGAIQAITDSVDAAERMAGVNIKHAVISVGGAHVESQNSKGVVAVANPESEISTTDIDRVLEAARALSLPSGREILHVIPKEYKVDAQDGIKDPRGMSGIRLECEAHVITVSSVSIRNITKCIEELGITPTAILFSGLASARAVLSETEKELGVVVLDIGAGTTSMMVFVEGSPTITKVLPVGARHVTQDIALGLKISLEAAEHIKLALRRILTTPKPPEHETRDQARERKKKEDELHLETLGIVDGPSVVSKKFLVEGIIEPRIVELLKLVGKDLESNRLFEMVPAGVVITGGGSEIPSMIELSKKVLRLPTRVSRPASMRGLTEEVSGPQFSTAVGLLLSSEDTFAQDSTPNSGDGLNLQFLSSITKKLQQIIKQVFP